ncbi:MAG: LamG domain-containing protein [Labilithrix sp.]
MGSRYRDAVLSDSPILYFRLGETSGTTAKDASGKGHDGAVNGTVGWRATGALAGDQDTALAFDGASTYIDVGNAISFSGRAPYTLEAWIFTELIDGSFRHIVMKNWEPTTDVREDFGVYVEKSNGLVFERIVGGATRTARSTQTDTLIGRWAYVVARYDGSVLALFVDGVQVGETADTRSQPTKDVPLLLGKRYDAPSFSGVIDEIAIYDTALPAARIAAHYALAR